MQTQPEPTTLDTYFDREALTWTDDEVKLIIAGFRKQSHAWTLEQEAAKREKRPAKRVSAKKISIAKELGLDLDLDF